MKHNVTLVAAVVSSFLSTACCLPPLLFVFFGVSFGWMSVLSSFAFLRLPLALLAVGLFALALYARRRQLRCSGGKAKWWLAGVFVLVLGLLVYPEVAVFFV